MTDLRVILSLSELTRTVCIIDAQSYFFSLSLSLTFTRAQGLAEAWRSKRNFIEIFISLRRVSDKGNEGKRNDEGRDDLLQSKFGGRKEDFDRHASHSILFDTFAKAMYRDRTFIAQEPKI